MTKAMDMQKLAAGAMEGSDLFRQRMQDLRSIRDYAHKVAREAGSGMGRNAERRTAFIVTHR